MLIFSVINCNTKQILAVPDNASDINPLISSIISVLIVLHVSEFNTGRGEILRCSLCLVVSPLHPRLPCELTWEMSTDSNKDLSTLLDKFLFLQQRAGNSSQLMESCLEFSFLCLQMATDLCISAGFRIADFVANMLWKQTFGKVIKSCERFMTVVPGSVWCYLTISFTHCRKCLHFPALPRIVDVIVPDIFWNLSLWTFFCTIFCILAHSFLLELVYSAQSHAQAVDNDKLHKEM